MSSSPLASPERDQACTLLKDWIQKGSLPYESGEWQHCSGLTREMVWTCIRHKGALDAWIDHLSTKAPSQNLIPFLWIGLCQLLLLDGIPDHAAVHETLESAKRSGLPAPPIGFMNAVFRRTLREKEALLKWMETQIPEKRYSHSKVLIDRWEKTYGASETQKILKWNQERSHTYARITLIGKHLKSDLALPPETLAHPFREGFYQLPRGFSPSQLEDFEKGAWYIQDPSTAMAPALLNVQPGERVLDACAAPGGKTALLAESLGEQTSRLLACDTNSKRCERLRENLTRLQFEEVEVKATDLPWLPTDPDSRFDAILLDVPCSNTGVYQRRPDAKWNFRKKLLTELIQLQYRILTQALPLLRPGGRMVYSTCSIEDEETTRQIKNWLGQHPECELIFEKVLLPGEEKSDGAYAALIRLND